MPLMLMARNWTVPTSFGHTIIFEKDTPLYVPDDQRIIEQCLGAGATYIEAAPALPDQEAPPSPVTMTKDAVKAKCYELFKLMLDNSEDYRDNFTAFGRPNAKFVSSKLGFEVSAKEVEEHWISFRKTQ